MDVIGFKETEIFDFFDEHTKEFIVAIIPKKNSEGSIATLLKYKNCTIYQHGYEHLNNVKEGWCDEFPESIDRCEIAEKLKLGKMKLENTLNLEIKGYVPPWNNTSNVTIEILSELGFEIYSAQKNNTVNYKKNKDIDIDIIESYEPFIIYKDLDELYETIISNNAQTDEIGIMYHFKNITSEDWKKICEFILKIELLNS